MKANKKRLGWAHIFYLRRFVKINVRLLERNLKERMNIERKRERRGSVTMMHKAVLSDFQLGLVHVDFFAFLQRPKKYI